MTHITTTAFPRVTNCTRCGSALVGRTDGMKTTRIQRKTNGKSWPTIAWLCEPCALEA